MARKSKTNKNVVIVALIVMLLLLAVGYAAFSDTLTISGTANAKGTFDLQFENAEIVKAVGVATASEGDAEGANVTSAKVSADGNTLNVNVADLAYPGAGVEFSVDIVNKGSISAKVNELTTDGLEGNDIIKIEGLDQITTDHPTIKAGEKCNIHFIVYWTEESTAVLPEEGTSVNFSLGIEYTQSDDNAIFDGKASHDGVTVEPEPVLPEVKSGKLTEIIDGADYGKKINYSVTVNGVTVDSWRVFSNDGTNVKIITTDYLPQTAIPQASLDAGLEKVTEEGKTTYNVNSTVSKDRLLAGLTTGWEEYAKGVEGATAQGTPTNAEFVASWNANEETKERQLEAERLYANSREVLVDTTTKLEEKGLYVLEIHDKCCGCWLATPSANDPDTMWFVRSNNTSSGYMMTYTYDGYGNMGIRPVVTLPSSVLGEVSDTVTIIK